MTLVLVLDAASRPGAIAGGRSTPVSLVPDDFDPACYGLALLGQDPVATWSGPAPFALAAAGHELAEDETAYLLSPVRVPREDPAERITEVVPLGPIRTGELLEALEEELVGEALMLVPGRPAVLVLAEPLKGPPTLLGEPLVGRSLEEIPSGPPALLDRVIDGSARACADAGRPRGATHLFPHSPGGPSGVRPLRETWLGLGTCAVVGGSSFARSLAGLLHVGHVASHPGAAVATAAGLLDGHDLVVVVCEQPGQDLTLLRRASALVVAGQPRAGQVELTWRGPAGVELGAGCGLLRPLLPGKV